jgi:predicted DNA-binding WGR domain protein
MNVVQTGLLEACDLHSQNAQERLGLLLNALHAYSNGSRHGLLDYAEKYPFTRLKDLPGDPPPPPASKPAAPTPAPATSGFRRFEFHEGGSSKFWEVALDGSHQTVKFGRIGTAGQSKTKSFASEAEAKKDTDKLIAEKTGKGYAEV